MQASKKLFEQAFLSKQERLLFSSVSQPKVKKCSFNTRWAGHECNRPTCGKKELWRNALSTPTRSSLAFIFWTYLYMDKEMWERKAWIRGKASNCSVKYFALLIEAQGGAEHSTHSSIWPDREVKGSIFQAGVRAAAEITRQRTHVVLKVWYLQRLTNVPWRS